MKFQFATHTQETINGKLCFDTKTEIRHEGINLHLEGFVNLQTTSKNVGLLETFSNTVKVNLKFISNNLKLKFNENYNFIYDLNQL